MRRLHGLHAARSTSAIDTQVAHMPGNPRAVDAARHRPLAIATAGPNLRHCRFVFRLQTTEDARA